MLDFDVRQRRRRFVHDEDARIERQRFGDLDELLLGDLRKPNRTARRDGEIKFG